MDSPDPKLVATSRQIPSNNSINDQLLGFVEHLPIRASVLFCQKK